MSTRMIWLPALSAGLLALTGAPAASQPRPADTEKAKKALQEVQDFIGVWNLEGLQKDAAKTIAWREQVTWSWKFQDGDAWLTVTFAPAKGTGDPKVYTHGTLKYDVARKKYVLTLVRVNKTEERFEGELRKQGGLVLTRKDAPSGDVHRLTLYTLAEGVRFQFRYEKQEGGKGLFENVFAMTGGKEGESFAGGGTKKPECVVSGGAANIAVSIAGKTYYVCCSGCRDELLANPNKYIAGKK